METNGMTLELGALPGVFADFEGQYFSRIRSDLLRNETNRFPSSSSIESSNLKVCLMECGTSNLTQSVQL